MEIVVRLAASHPHATFLHTPTRTFLHTPTRTFLHTPMHTFLHTCRLHLAAKHTPLAFVTGNEACDLDSVVSAIVFAFLFNRRYHGRVLVPFVNTPRHTVLCMRGEVMHVLGALDIGVADLLFLDDVLASDTTTFDVYLLDHNQLSTRWQHMASCLQPRVLGILDHREDAGLFVDASPRIITPAGSCASLVADLALHDTAAWSAAVANMLLATIVFDTVNFTWRTTPRDVATAAQLWALVHQQSSAEPELLAGRTRPLYEQLCRALIDESQFAFGDLLYKDLKVCLHKRRAGHVLLYAVAVLHLDDLQHSMDRAQVAAFLAREDAAMLLIINVVGRGYERRQQLGVQFAKGMEQEPEHVFAFLQEKQCDLDTTSVSFICEQRNLEISRKQLQPYLREYLALCYP